MISYWGVDHGDEISKAWGDRNRKPSERSLTRRPYTANTRRENVKAGAKVVGAEYGAIGAGLGLLATRGKAPGSGARLYGRAARTQAAAIGGAGGAALGVPLGAGLGAIMPNKKSPGAKRTTNYADRQFAIKQEYKQKKNKAFDNYLSGR